MKCTPESIERAKKEKYEKSTNDVGRIVLWCGEECRIPVQAEVAEGGISNDDTWIQEVYRKCFVPSSWFSDVIMMN